MNTKKTSFLEQSERILSPADMQNQDEAISNMKSSDKKSRIDKINDIIEQKSAMKINGQVIDLFSASIYRNVYNSLSDDNKKKLNDMPIKNAIQICYKLSK